MTALQIVIGCASAAWTLGSLMWTIRAERAMRALTKQGDRVELQLMVAARQIADFETYLDKTPTLHFPIARERVRQ